jgi:hypothetical protein
MPGIAGLELAGVDRDQVAFSLMPQLATGPSFMVSPKNGSSASHAIGKSSRRCA